jgi:hypothetical protein
VLVEAIVLGSQDRSLHQLRDVVDLDHGALFLAELPDELRLGAVDPQRDLRPVVGEHVEARQVRPKQDDRERADPRRDQNERHGDQRRIKPPTGRHGKKGSAIRLMWPLMSGAGSIYRSHYSRHDHCKALP